MPRGGKREGAGRPKGAANKASVARQAEIAASGLTPLDYMLGILRDEARDETQRFEAAKAAAPYVHPRLASTEVRGELQVNDVSADPELSEAEWSREHGHA
jgi:hypothetical protein